MSTRRLLAPAVAGVVALCATAALAAPALAATRPAADALLARSAVALQKATSLHVDLEAHTRATGDGSLTPAQLRKAAAPVDITAQGDLSQTVIAIRGKLGSGTQTLAAELRASGKEVYVNFMGTWYGDKSTSTTGRGGLTLNTSPEDLSGSLSDLLRSGMTAEVKPGPTVDGVATWQVDGTFKGPALAKALKKAGTTVSPGAITRLAAKAAVTILIGRDDDLPRRIAVDETLAGADLSSAKSTTGGLVPLPTAGTRGVKSVKVTMLIELSKFGQEVAFERPASYRPLEEMIGALLGGLGSGSGSPSSAKPKSA